MKKIVIIANFCPEFYGNNGGRFLEVAQRLINESCEYNVYLITSDFLHSSKKYKTLYTDSKVKIIYIHEPIYKRNISIRRLFAHWVWGLRVVRYLKSNTPPDCIYCAVPSLTAAYLSARYAIKNNATYIIDIQDLWPEAFELTLKNKILQRIFFSPIKKLASYIYKQADEIIAVSQTYLNRALSVNMKCNHSLCIYLGNDRFVFDKAKIQYHIDKPQNELWICYIGTLGYSYDIPCVIDALNILKQDNDIYKDIKFIVVGDGPLHNMFYTYAKNMNVNVEFTGRVQYNKMVGILCSCDIAINPIKKGAAQSITNKVGDYALSGLPVINTQECLEYRELIEQYNCGINCNVGNAYDVSQAIKLLMNNQKIRTTMGIASRRLGEERFDRNNTYGNIISIIKKSMK